MRKAFLLLPLAFLGSCLAVDDVREVKLEVTGTAKWVQITATSNSGGIEQADVEVPYYVVMYRPAGSIVSLSAQKTRIVKRRGVLGDEVVADGTGTVRVAIKAAGRVLQEAESSARYGVAQASAAVPN